MGWMWRAGREPAMLSGAWPMSMVRGSAVRIRRPRARSSPPAPFWGLCAQEVALPECGCAALRSMSGASRDALEWGRVERVARRMIGISPVSMTVRKGLGPGPSISERRSPRLQPARLRNLNQPGAPANQPVVARTGRGSVVAPQSTKMLRWRPDSVLWERVRWQLFRAKASWLCLTATVLMPVREAPGPAGPLPSPALTGCLEEVTMRARCDVNRSAAAPLE